MDPMEDDTEQQQPQPQPQQQQRQQDMDLNGEPYSRCLSSYVDEGSTESHRYYLSRRTLLEMLRDRGYSVPAAEIELSLQDFRSIHGQTPDIERLRISASRRSDPLDKILVIFCGPGIVKVNVIRIIGTMIGNKDSLSRLILVVQNRVTNQAMKAMDLFSFKVEVFQITELLVNITKHALKPKHRVLTDEEKKKLLKKFSLEEKQLPRMLQKDAISRYYGLEKGHIILIHPKSPTIPSQEKIPTKMLTPNDLENATPYTPLPDSAASSADRRRPIKALAGLFLSVLFLSLLIVLIFNQDPQPSPDKVMNENDQPTSSPLIPTSPEKLMPPSRRMAQGVSEKTFRDFSDEHSVYPWSNAMLDWQRTAFHFQPEKNWMNDPNGPLFYKGWYHIFYQYNPESAVWGNIAWGHAVSEDMIHWLHLPSAMEPDNWFDANGVWTGSATILPDGQIVMLYTGSTDKYVQVQNLAYPANLSDPLLLDWVKYPGNPVLVPPQGIHPKDFRDPTTAWVNRDGKWRVAIGSKVNSTGITLVYETTNFTSFELLDGVMHAVPGTGMWECVDFYPVSTSDANGLDTSFNGPGIKHVLKASLDDEKKDYYAIGIYEPVNNTWTPDNPEMDVGIGLRVDYGVYYASKTFYDQNKQRRISWSWIGETDNESDDLLKGWASVQTIPRTVVFDKKTGSNILQWPVDDVERLRLNGTEFHGVELGPGSVVPLNIGSATQLDIVATFEVDKAALEATTEADVGHTCSTTGGAVSRGALGPFGLLVLADESLSELTPVYFYISKDIDGSYKTFFCSDEMRSSKASSVNKRVHGGTVPVLEGEKFSMRLLVDHSIVESFAQGGRTVITSRIYPTRAIDGAARVFLFNNATGTSVTASLKIWQMDSAHIHQFLLDQI